MRGQQAHPILRGHALASSAWIAASARVGARRARVRTDDRGEGVISAALVVLIMALIAAAMWTAFDGIWDDVEQQTEDKVTEIGQ